MNYIGRAVSNINKNLASATSSNGSSKNTNEKNETKSNNSSNNININICGNEIDANEPKDANESDSGEETERDTQSNGGEVSNFGVRDAEYSNKNLDETIMIPEPV